jgi:hypothetical protein
MTRPNRIRCLLRIRVKWERIDGQARSLEKAATGLDGRTSQYPAPMRSAEISFYNVVLFVHIAAVVLAFGVTFSFPIVLGVARKSYERHMGFYHRVQALILIAIFLMVTKPGA